MDSSMTITTASGMTVLIPDEGKKLYDGSVYSDKVYLGKFDSADNWQEVDEDAEETNEGYVETQETYEELQEQMNQIREVYAE